jgi:hypothetical protein
MTATELTVLTAYFNPARYRTRTGNDHRFAQHMRATPGVRLVTVECAFGNDAFELDADDAAVQVRAEHPLWVKENLLNLGWARADTPYIAWIDNDIIFQERDWAARTIAALRDHLLVQPWSRVYSLDADGRRMGSGRTAFCRVHHAGFDGFCQNGCCHTGYAWAARREVFEATGGLLEHLIVGGADYLMTMALFDYDRALWRIWRDHDSAVYPSRIDAWCRKYAAAVGRRIGYADGDIHHLFHGSPVQRQYVSRHALTAVSGFDADVHLCKNADGVNQIVGLPVLCGQIREYFQDRQEDEGRS